MRDDSDNPRPRRAVILAAGRGARLRAGAEAADLAPRVRRFAAGLRELCFVVRPERSALHEHLERLSAAGAVTVQFAVQTAPRGTADALAAAASAVGDEPFVMINSDNIYPAEAIEKLLAAPGPAAVGFTPAALAGGGIEPQRIAALAVMRTDPAGRLMEIVEKPGPDEQRDARLISMNCWRFDPAIFAACRATPPSPRGEYELPDAVDAWRRAAGRAVHVATCRRPVYDLTSIDDVRRLQRRLDGAGLRLPGV